jgi:hypothetical protein
MRSYGVRNDDRGRVGLPRGFAAASGYRDEDFQAKWRAAGWPEETYEVFELHNSRWPT